MGIEAQIELRKQEAAEKGIVEQACTVTSQLGYEPKEHISAGPYLPSASGDFKKRAFKKRGLEIKDFQFSDKETGLPVHRVNISYKGSAVFDAMAVDGKKPDIYSYVPGPWEQKLAPFFTEALMKAGITPNRRNLLSPEDRHLEKIGADLHERDRWGL